MISRRLGDVLAASISKLSRLNHFKASVQPNALTYSINNASLYVCSFIVTHLRLVMQFLFIKFSLFLLIWNLFGSVLLSRSLTEHEASVSKFDARSSDRDQKKKAVILVDVNDDNCDCSSGDCRPMCSFCHACLKIMSVVKISDFRCKEMESFQSTPFFTQRAEGFHSNLLKPPRVVIHSPS
jgi:hypothetical protein